MAEHVKVTDEFGDYYYIYSSSSKDVLTWKEKTENATYIYNFCRASFPTWTDKAIAAILGNVQSEGILNPAQWEYGKNERPSSGYGLVQWTPSTKFIDWAKGQALSITAISTQIKRLEYERKEGLQYYKTSAYPLTFTEFLSSSKSADYLAAAWLYNYERPANPQATISVRKRQALEWYKFITGIEPAPPDPGPKPTNLRKGMPILYYPKYHDY